MAQLVLALPDGKVVVHHDITELLVKRWEGQEDLTVAPPTDAEIQAVAAETLRVHNFE